ncbi:DcaP family trimeric outer membrane transporter [Zavarzinia compransoris]|uniref:Uncharacterized protein n=1 Tax=Zavarzinia compransoris TaxID=1264899 RepID=A0A317E5K8_9PROT|nr:DcaP family trimeric outer membrane transporter [Zavarzinia compransoris]PWR21644.1 hypothetical protein DKG75_06490 [Zavarzinia compransoris]TDP45575.1 porin-like protein [Zavarzinia compransoris]
MWKGSIILAALALPATAMAADPAIEDLKRQIDALQSKVQALEGRQQATEVKQEQALTEDDLKGSMPGSIRIPGTSTSLKIGGYVKLDGVYDFGGPSGSTASADGIPIGGVPVRDNQFQFNARQSRINIATETPFDDIKVRSFIEVDFYGTGGNEAASNSAGIRLRQAVVTAGAFTVGQTFTTLYDAAAATETLDFAARPGETSIRQPLVRYTWKQGPGALAVSLENPESDFTGNVAANSAVPTALGSVPNPNFDHVPDLVGSYTYSFDWGHLSAQGLLRQVSVDNGTVEDSVVGYGLGLSGSIKLGGKSKLMFHGLYGSGIARYFALGFGGSASFDGTSLDAQTAWGGDVTLQYWWTDTVRSNVAVSYQDVDYNSIALASANKELMSVHANLIATILPPLDVGIEYIHARRETFGGLDGDLDRLQASVIYRY